jgi:hypothetical protein
MVDLEARGARMENIRLGFGDLASELLLPFTSAPLSSPLVAGGASPSMLSRPLRLPSTEGVGELEALRLRPKPRVPFFLGVGLWEGLGLEGGVWVKVTVSVAVAIAVSMRWGRKWSLVSVERQAATLADFSVVNEERGREYRVSI